MTWLTVPIIDIAPYWTGVDAGKRDVARQIGEACRDIGFLVIAGHRVPPDLIAAVDDVSREFFDLPLDEKMKVVRPAPDVTRGYIPRSEEHTSELQSHSDLVCRLLLEKKKINDRARPWRDTCNSLNQLARYGG